MITLWKKYNLKMKGKITMEVKFREYIIRYNSYAYGDWSDKKVLVFFHEIPNAKKQKLVAAYPDAVILDDVKEYLDSSDVILNMRKYIVLSEIDVSVISKWWDDCLNKYANQKENVKKTSFGGATRKQYMLKENIYSSLINRKSTNGKYMILLFEPLKKVSSNRLRSRFPHILIIDNIMNNNYEDDIDAFKRLIEKLLDEKKSKWKITDSDMDNIKLWIEHKKQKYQKDGRLNVKPNITADPVSPEPDPDDKDQENQKILDVKKEIESGRVIGTCTGKLIPCNPPALNSKDLLKNVIQNKERKNQKTYGFGYNSVNDHTISDSKESKTDPKIGCKEEKKLTDCYGHRKVIEDQIKENYRYNDPVPGIPSMDELVKAYYRDSHSTESEIFANRLRDHCIREGNEMRKTNEENTTQDPANKIGYDVDIDAPFKALEEYANDTDLHNLPKLLGMSEERLEQYAIQCIVNSDYSKYEWTQSGPRHLCTAPIAYLVSKLLGDIATMNKIVESYELADPNYGEEDPADFNPATVHESKYDYYLYIGADPATPTLFNFTIYEMGNGQMIPVTRFKAPFGAVALVSEEYKRLCVINVDDYIIRNKR